MTSHRPHTGAELDYAERIVRKGFGTPEEAAELCRVPLETLQARLACDPRSARTEAGERRSEVLAPRAP